MVLTGWDNTVTHGAEAFAVILVLMEQDAARHLCSARALAELCRFNRLLVFQSLFKELIDETNRRVYAVYRFEELSNAVHVWVEAWCLESQDFSQFLGFRVKLIVVHVDASKCTGHVAVHVVLGKLGCGLINNELISNTAIIRNIDDLLGAIRHQAANLAVVKAVFLVIN